jgi:hypothetical protein
LTFSGWEISTQTYFAFLLLSKINEYLAFRAAKSDDDPNLIKKYNKSGSTQGSKKLAVINYYLLKLKIRNSTQKCLKRKKAP